MSRPGPEIEQLAQQWLAADERRITGARRTSVSLGDALAAFARHPSPWMVGGTLAVALAARPVVGEYRWTDAAVPLALVAAFPLTEWVVHVFVLRWRPRRMGPVELDSLLARKQREHHADPRDIPLEFIPWQVLAWLLPAYVGVALLAFPRTGLGLTFLASVAAALGAGLRVDALPLVHSDYRPRSRAYRAAWRNHRLHH